MQVYMTAPASYLASILIVAALTLPVFWLLLVLTGNLSKKHMHVILSG